MPVRPQLQVANSGSRKDLHVLVQAAAPTIDATVEDSQIALPLERRHDPAERGKVVDVELLVLPPEAVLRDKEQMRSRCGELIEGEEMVRPDIGHFKPPDVDIASRSGC